MRRFKCEKAPSKSRFQNWVDHFEKYGTVESLNAASENRSSHSGRPQKRTAKLVKSVRESLQQSPKRNVRKRSQSLGMSRETCRRTLVNNIRAYPYRIQPQKRSRGALCQSRCSGRSRSHQVSLTSFGPQMKPTSILTERRTPSKCILGVLQTQ